MQNNAFRYSLGALILLGLAFYAFTWQLREGSVAIRLRLGRAVDVVDTAGLHGKMPWPVDQIVVLDGRRRVLKTRHTEMLTRDKKNVILLSYVVWSVSDPLRFYQSVGDVEAGDAKLIERILSFRANEVHQVCTRTVWEDWDESAPHIVAQYHHV